MTLLTDYPRLSRGLLSLIFSVGFFVWTTSYGVRSYTDDPKRIPKKYVESAVEVSWEALRERADKRWTVGPNYGRQMGN